MENEETVTKPPRKWADKRKAKILDLFLHKMALEADVVEVVKCLGGSGYDGDAIFYRSIVEDPLEKFLANLFDTLDENEICAIFKKHLSELLCKELEAKSVTIEW